MFTKSQHVYINDEHNRYHGKEAIVLTAYGDYYDVQLVHSLMMRVVGEQLSSSKPVQTTH